MGLEYIYQIVSFFQNVALMFSNDSVQLPIEFEFVKQFFNAILDFDFKSLVADFAFLEKYTLIDFRIIYLFLNVLLPLCLALVILLLFQDVIVIIWYFLLLAGFLAIVVGLFAFLLPQEPYSLFMSKIWIGTVQYPIPPELLIIALGAIVVFVMLIIGFIVLSFKEIRRQINLKKIEDSLGTNIIKQGRGKNIKNLRNLFKRKKREVGIAQYRYKRAEQEQSLNYFGAVINIFSAFLFVVLGIFLLQLIQVNTILELLQITGWENNFIDSTFSDPDTVWVYRVFGIGFIISGFFLMFQTMMSCCAFGRKLSYNLVRFGKHTMLKIILLILTSIYTPVITSLVNSLICSDYTCPKNTQFLPQYDTLSIDTLLKEDSDNSTYYCESCNFLNVCNLTDVLCPGATQFQLMQQPSINCYSEMMPFFWPATVMLLIIFGAGVPLFYCLFVFRAKKKMDAMDVDFLLDRYVPLWIRNPSKALKMYKKNEKKPIKKKKGKLATNYEFKPPNQPVELVKRRREEEKVLSEKEMKKLNRKLDKERWIIKMSISENPGKTLYRSFESKWRYYRIFSVCVKAILVSLTLICNGFSILKLWSLPMQFGIHFVGLAGMIISFPYINFGEDVLSIFCGFLELVDCGYLTASQWYQFDSWTAIPLAVLNLTLPFLLVVLYFHSFFFKKKHKTFYNKLTNRLKTLQQKGVINVQRKIPFTKLQRKIKDADEILTDDAMQCTLIFFMILGIATFFSFVCVALGLLYDEFNPSYIPNDYQIKKYAQETSLCSDIRINEFAGYDSWENFTANCCCMETTHHETNAFTYNYKLVEMWYCRNGKKKERVRSIDLTIDGQTKNLTTIDTVRPFCGNEFYPSFNLSTPCNGGNSVDYSVLVGGEDILEEYDTLAERDDDFNVRKYYW